VLIRTSARHVGGEIDYAQSVPLFHIVFSINAVAAMRKMRKPHYIHECGAMSAL
jgi:hypothetical protein